jgi:hypothetical protein
MAVGEIVPLYGKIGSWIPRAKEGSAINLPLKRCYQNTSLGKREKGEGNFKKFS